MVNIFYIIYYSPEVSPEHTGFKGLFSNKKFISFQIDTSPLNLSCRRKYSDFEWLRSILIKMYSGIYIPPLPRKTLEESAGENKIQKRMRILNRFLNSLVDDHLLKNSEILYKFLSTKTYNDFDNIKKNYEYLTENVNLNKCRTRSGKIIIDKSIASNESLYTSIQNNLNGNISELTKLSKSFKKLFQEISAVNKRYLEIASIFNNLYTISMRNSENENLIKSYANMKRLMEGLGNNELKLAKNIELDIREYFKYVKSEYYASQELYEKYSYIKNLYMKNLESLMKKKEKLFNTQDTSNWELKPGININIKDKQDCFNKMLPKETMIVNNFRNFYMYLAIQCKNEFMRLREIIGFQNREKMKGFYNNNTQVLKELNGIWDTFSLC